MVYRHFDERFFALKTVEKAQLSTKSRLFSLSFRTFVDIIPVHASVVDYVLIIRILDRKKFFIFYVLHKYHKVLGGV